MELRYENGGPLTGPGGTDPAPPASATDTWWLRLTKTGDTSPDSGLAVDRFDTAKGGEISYERGSIKVSEDVAEDILSGESAVVIHGVDYNGDGEYSGDERKRRDRCDGPWSTLGLLGLHRSSLLVH